MPKVLVIGLDGATFDVIRPLAQMGRLPHLAQLLEKGAWGPLASVVPPITPTAWTSVFTGKNPGKHGIYDFQSLDRETYERRPVRVDAHQEKSLWDLLGEAGKRSIVLDVPYTYPPRPLHGLMITGYGTPRTPHTQCAYPAGLAEQLPVELREEVKVALPRHRFDRSQALIDEWKEVMSGRRHLLSHLMVQEEWDFFFVVFNITDNLAHIFWTYTDPNHPNYQRPEAAGFRDAFHGGYEQCDAIIGELMSLAGPETTTLIMSDHGFGSIYPRQHLFQRLVDGDFLRYQSAPYITGLSDNLMKLAIRTYNGLPFLREWLKGLRPGSQEAISRGLDRAGLLPDSQSVDTRRSRVLPTNFGLQMWVNHRDSFRQGFVSEKQVVLRALEKHLRKAKDPATGRPVIAATHRGEDLYHGPRAAAGPDLVIEYSNFFRPGESGTHQNPRLEGGHTGQGIFLAHGPAILPGQVRPAGLVDLAPTILHLLEQPIPPDMDGRVLAEIFSDSYRAAHPVRLGEQPAHFEESVARAEAAYSAEEEAAIEESLRQLGYI